MNKNILAKSTGESLLEHSNKVFEFSKHLLDYFKNKEKYEDIIKYATLLHDIGKCTESFQSLLNKNNKKSKNVFSHNEIGWAFLINYLNVNNNILEDVCNLVYWHHGISNKPNKHTADEILDTITTEDINNMKNETITILGSIDYVLEESREYLKRCPFYLSSENDNNDLILLRSVLITADRFVSENFNLNNGELILKFEEKQNKISDYNFNTSAYTNDRFEIQKNIANECDKTTIVKAPAGFGKTLIGLLWSIKNNKKVLWVCPRNAIAHSVYNSILDEAKKFNIKINIELYLSGEVKNKNHENIEDFNSDIIVTNIDNFLSPTVNNSNANKSFFTNSVNVIFDEYHELVQENPIFSLFLSLMNIRHRYTNSNTLLLSATPIKLHNLWDHTGNKTKILPDEISHYPAAHDKKYKLNIIDKLDFTNLKNNNLIIFNSIKNAQLFKNKINNSELIHGNYDTNTKKIKFDNLFNLYNKYSERTENKTNIVATHIMQASLDVSFLNLYESVVSPESTLQRIGRADRWGDYLNESNINIFNYNDKTENAVKNSLYDKDLINIWFNYIKEYNNKNLSLNEFYDLYNNFNIKYNAQISAYIQKTKREANKLVDKIYPIQFYNKLEKTNIITAGSNKLRSTGNEIFYICKKSNSDEYSDIFNKKILYGIDKEFNETSDTLTRILTVMEALVNDTRFSYKDVILNNSKKNKLTLDNLRFKGKKSDTPYVRLDVVYDNEYGVISKELFLELQNN